MSFTISLVWHVYGKDGLLFLFNIYRGENHENTSPKTGEAHPNGIILIYHRYQPYNLQQIRQTLLFIHSFISLSDSDRIISKVDLNNMIQYSSVIQNFQFESYHNLPFQIQVIICYLNCTIDESLLQLNKIRFNILTLGTLVYFSVNQSF